MEWTESPEYLRVMEHPRSCALCRHAATMGPRVFCAVLAEQLQKLQHTVDHGQLTWPSPARLLADLQTHAERYRSVPLELSEFMMINADLAADNERAKSRRNSEIFALRPDSQPADAGVHRGRSRS